MNYEEMIDMLCQYPHEKAKEVVRILIKIADNVLKEPNNVKFRILEKKGETFSKKIMPVSGALICLNLMGFQENSACFLLPLDISLSRLEEVRTVLMTWQNSLVNSTVSVSSEENNEGNLELGQGPQNSTRSIKDVKPIILPDLVSLFTNPFLHEIETCFHNCLSYENVEVQNKARRLIPLAKLEANVRQGLAVMKEQASQSNSKASKMSAQEAFILELLRWFKEDLFSWVNSPPCGCCGGNTTFSYMSTDPMDLINTNRVEMHKCQICQKLNPFPRYVDLNILLETRKGRCGEWARTFTLFCRSMGWDARLVLDQTDHAWTEVYSIAQKRWLHCDPCENICDTPLVYEAGWKKSLSYIIAYSGDEVQDVTWRYSSDHKAILERRKKCTEKELIDALIILRRNRQASFSKPRQMFLTERLLVELAELMCEKKPSGSYEGRKSGSEAWRRARGEIELIKNEDFIWKIDANALNEQVVLRYSAALDHYEYVVDNELKTKIEKFGSGVFKSNDLFRKEEKDWNQVYICRKEGCITDGLVSWKFQVEGEFKTLQQIELDFSYRTFEEGSVIRRVYCDNACEVIPNSVQTWSINCVGTKFVTVEAVLSGGKKNIAWQHAQLFRQDIDSEAFPFIVKFIFN